MSPASYLSWVKVPAAPELKLGGRWLSPTPRPCPLQAGSAALQRKTVCRRKIPLAFQQNLNNQSAQRTLETISGVRGFVPAAVAAAVGVLTGKFAPLRIAHCRITSHPSVRIEFKS